MAQLAEHILGKDEVISSTLISSSKKHSFECFFFFVLYSTPSKSLSLTGAAAVHSFAVFLREKIVADPADGCERYRTTFTELVCTASLASSSVTSHGPPFPQWEGL